MHVHNRSKLGAMLTISVAAALVGCGSGSSTSSSSGGGSGGGGGGALVVAVVSPFTGADAVFGQVVFAGCVPAASLINSGGGVLGHTISCQSVDTHGDAADAVPAVEQLLATTPNLAGMIGPSADEATATVPAINRAQVTMFADTGEAAFDQSQYQYFWRLTPADDQAGYAMAVWAHKSGYTTAAAVFGNDVSAQGSVPTLMSGFEKLGGTIVANVSIAPGQSSYRTEAQTVLAAHPQVIFDEMDPQTSATFFNQLKALNGAMLPAIGADPTLTPDWFTAVSKAIGTSDLIKYVTAENPSADTSGDAWQVFNTALLASSAQVSDPGQYSTQSYTEHEYDAVNIMALAMIKANSVSPAKYNAQIFNVTRPRSGAVVVRNFADGKRALAAGHEIQYVGPGGPVLFDQWHSAASDFTIERWDASGANVTIGTLSPTDIATAR